MKRQDRGPKFSPGVCLSLRHPDGRYSAGLVTAVHDSDPAHRRDLIVLLDYLSDVPPSLEDFEARKWLYNRKGSLMCFWYGPSGFETVADRLTAVGAIDLVDADPKDASLHADWPGFGPFVVRLKDASP